MRTIATLTVLAALALISAPAADAAEPGQVDNNALSAFGLSGMEVMSDVEGDQVRGTFAIVWGQGSANFFGTNQTNGYAAGDFGPGPDFAAGGNVSVAGGGFATNAFGGTVWGVAGTFAVGGSVAYAGP